MSFFNVSWEGQNSCRLARLRPVVWKTFNDYTEKCWTRNATVDQEWFIYSVFCSYVGNGIQHSILSGRWAQNGTLRGDRTFQRPNKSLPLDGCGVRFFLLERARRMTFHDEFQLHFRWRIFFKICQRQPDPFQKITSSERNTIFSRLSRKHKVLICYICLYILSS